MHDLRWTLLAWTVVAIAACIRFSRLASRWHSRRQKSDQPSDAIRQQLERAWEQD